jgi:CheY-like chemotaxis protein
MDRTVFNGLFKDLMAHIHDYAALENHPLAARLKIPQNYQASRGHYLQEMVLDEIEQFRPTDKEPSIETIEWRPYLILHQRYTKGMSSQELADYLAISKRQMRRDHSKALQALAGRLWDQAFEKELVPPPEGDSDEAREGSQAFEIHPGLLDLAEVLQGVIRILQRHLDSEGVELELNFVSGTVLTDRVILRQILISLFNYALHIQSDQPLCICTQTKGEYVSVEFTITADQHWSSWDEEREDWLSSVRLWSPRLGADFEESYPPPDRPGTVRLIFKLPIADQTTILVIDDQQPTLRMYQRYLSRSNFKVVGLDNPKQAHLVAHQIQPDVILLDVMMPQVDGWEIFQALQLDEALNQIPVIICSAWESADLAKSLGAAEFLKKPITQEQLLTAIQELAS